MDTPNFDRTACFICVTNGTMLKKTEDEMFFEEIQSRLSKNGIEVREGQLLKLSIRKVVINLIRVSLPVMIGDQ